MTRALVEPPTDFPPLPWTTRLTIHRAELEPTPTLEVSVSASPWGQRLLGLMLICFAGNLFVALAAAAESVAKSFGWSWWVGAVLTSGTALSFGVGSLAWPVWLLTRGHVLLTPTRAEIDRTFWRWSRTWNVELSPSDGLLPSGKGNLPWGPSIWERDGWRVKNWQWGPTLLLRVGPRVLPLGPPVTRADAHWLRHAALCVVGEATPAADDAQPPTIAA